MVIDCNNKDEIKDIWFGQFNSFARGSVMYGTAGDDSDLDIGIIVPDDTEFIDIDGVFDNEKCDTRLHPSVVTRVLDEGENNKALDIDCQFVCESDFIDMIKEHTPFAIEVLVTNAALIDIDKIVCWTIVDVHEDGSIKQISNKKFNNLKELISEYK